MAIREVLKCAVLMAFCLILPAQGQRLVVLPGSTATGSTASAFSPAPFAAAGTIDTGGPGADLAFSSPSGSNFYILTSSGVTVVDSSGAQVQSPIAITQPLAAALSPDGKRLVVVAGDASSGTAYIIDTSAGTAALVTSLPVAAAPFDVAIGPDSTTAYVLSSGALLPIDLRTNTAGTTVAVTAAGQGAATPGVAVGPNGLIYINSSAAIYELNPLTLAPLNAISLRGFPTKLSFYVDGSMAVVANQLATGTPAISVVDITNHAVTNTLENPGQQFTKLFYVSPTLVYATSASGFLYSFSPASPRTISPVSFWRSGGVRSAAVSSDTGLPSSIFLTTQTSVVGVDLTATPPTSSPLSLTTPSGPLFYLDQAQTGTPSTAMQFNGTQSVTAGGTSLPLAVRLIDSNGHAVANQSASWSAPAGVVLKNAMTTTNSQGVASAYAVVPSTAGTYSITASFKNTHVTSPIFKLTVGGGGGGGGDGGGGTPAAGISIVSGNGQVVRGSSLIFEPMIVLVTDSSGKPAANVPVTFSQGTVGGSLVVNQVDPDQSNCTVVQLGYSCTTDTTGHASIRFLGYPLDDRVAPYQQTSITASVAASGTTPKSSVTFTVTSIPILVTGTGGNYPYPAVISVNPPVSQVNPHLSGAAGTTLKGAIQVQVLGLLTAVPMPSIGLSLRPTASYTFAQSSPASCAGAGGTALTDSKGNASCDLVLGNTPGTYTLYRVVGAYDTSAVYTLTITAPPPPTPVPTTVGIISGNSQSGVIGRPFANPIVAVVRDQFGAIMANTSVTWSVLLGNATLSGQTAKTNASGQVSATLTPNAAGAIQVKVLAGTASAIFTETGTVAVTSMSKVSGDSQTAAFGAAFANPLTVQVNTASGPLASYPVAFTATGATLSAASVNTNAQGQASVTVTAGSTAGTAQVTATAGAQSVTFNLTVQPPGPQLSAASFVNGASFQSGFSFGSVVTIMAQGLTIGLNLSPGTCLTAPDGIEGVPSNAVLPTRIAGVEILFSGNLAPIFAICKNSDGTEQANVQAPFELAPGSIFVTVRYGAGTSAKTEFTASNVPVLSAAPGIFEYMADASTKLAVAVKDDGSLIGPSNPAHPGDTIHVYTTGLGPVLPHVATNQLGVAGQTPYFTPTATLGGTQMGGVTASYAEGMIGIFVVSFQIPSTQAVGTSVPLAVGVVTKPDNTAVPSQTSQITIAAK